jgi:hypothetical protein
LGCTEWTVYNALQAAGIPHRVPREYRSVARGVEPRSAEAADEVIEQYATGESAPAIAEQLGLGQWRVYRLLPARGALRTIGEARQAQERRWVAGSE